MVFAHRPRIPEEEDRAECSGPSTEPGRNHDQPERGAAQPQVRRAHTHTHFKRYEESNRTNRTETAVEMSRSLLTC